MCLAPLLLFAQSLQGILKYSCVNPEKQKNQYRCSHFVKELYYFIKRKHKVLLDDRKVLQLSSFNSLKVFPSFPDLRFFTTNITYGSSLSWQNYNSILFVIEISIDINLAKFTKVHHHYGSFKMK